jgi:cyclophilin family peptidyl-prolyl cis-trans isomerase
MKKKTAAFVMIILMVIGAIIAYQSINSSNQNGSENSNKILLMTSKGNITIELFEDTPNTTANFKRLTRQKVYDVTIFHRVNEFVIQGGDPTGTGYGDSRIPTIKDELPNRHSNVRGAIAMAKTSQPNSASSQFFINLVDNHANYDADYVVFGHVITGMDVVDAIGRVAVDGERPIQPVTLYKAQIIP